MEAQSPRRTRKDLAWLLLSFPTRPKKGGIVMASKQVIRAIRRGLTQEWKIFLKLIKN
jgi:hypothetical protein